MTAAASSAQPRRGGANRSGAVARKVAAQTALAMSGTDTAPRDWSEASVALISATTKRAFRTASSSGAPTRDDWVGESTAATTGWTQPERALAIAGVGEAAEGPTATLETMSRALTLCAEVPRPALALALAKAGDSTGIGSRWPCARAANDALGCGCTGADTDAVISLGSDEPAVALPVPA